MQIEVECSRWEWEKGTELSWATTLVSLSPLSCFFSQTDQATPHTLPPVYISFSPFSLLNLLAGMCAFSCNIKLYPKGSTLQNITFDLEDNPETPFGHCCHQHDWATFTEPVWANSLFSPQNPYLVTVVLSLHTLQCPRGQPQSR